MRKCSRHWIPTFVAAVLAAWGFAWSVETPAVEATAAEKPGKQQERLIREIFVPFEDLNVLLEGRPRRVLLSRDEYEQLIERAERAPEVRAPRAALLVSSDYTVTLQQDRARFGGTLVVDVLEEGLHAVPLDLGSVGLQSALLGDKSAPIGRADDGRLTLFVEGKGRHTLVLDVVAPLQTTAARQVLNFRLPHAPASRLRMTVPGDMEVKSGAKLTSRVVDEAAGLTRFELLAEPGDVSLVMTLNSRLQRTRRVVIARSVIVDELTEAYERLHATVSLAVLHQPVDRFRFVVPEGFEITEVGSPLLSSWAILTEDNRRLLEVRLREQTTETVVLNLSAVRTPVVLDAWTLPRLQPLDVVGQVAVVGLLVDDRLKAESIRPAGLIRINTGVLKEALPETVFRAEPGAVTLRPVVAYYAPQADYSLSARLTRPPAEMAVTTVLLLSLSERGQQLRGGLAVLPKVEKRFWLDFTVPQGWYVQSVTTAEGKPLGFERYGAKQKPGRIHVRLPQGVPPGKETRILFDAQKTPKRWLTGWEPAEVEFPIFAVAGAVHDAGAIAVEARDDLAVRPKLIERLVPLDEKEKKEFHLEGAATSLAYRYQSRPYRASLLVERTRPRLTARTFSFLRVQPGTMAAHYELIYDVEQARTRKLELFLPEDTPSDVAIHGLDSLKLKQYTASVADSRRCWSVLLAEPSRETIRLAVDFQQPLPPGEHKDLVLPIVRAGGVEYQSGVVAVEGSAELDVELKRHPRRVDVGELVDAEYQPGRRLLGAYGFVGDPMEKGNQVAIDVFRRPAYPLHPAIVQSARLTTRLAAEGSSQTEARFVLRTKALYLEVKLPQGSELWSVLLDGRPVKPQKQQRSVLVGLPAGSAGNARSLQLVYQTPTGAVGLTGTVEVPAPRLLLRGNEDTEPVEVPLADLQWELRLPTGYQAVRSSGTVVTNDIQRPQPAAVQVAKVLYVLAGGINELPIQAAREAARSIEFTGRPKASALIRVSSLPEAILFDPMQEEQWRGFELHRNTQAQLLKSPFVLSAALGKPEIARLGIVREQGNPVAWLQRELEVSFPGGGEIMDVRLDARDQREAAILVNAVVDAYMTQVAAGDENQHRRRLDALERVYTEKSNEIRSKRAALKGLADQLGTTDRSTLDVQQRIAVQQYGDLRKTLARQETELKELQEKLRTTEAKPDSKQADVREHIKALKTQIAVASKQRKQLVDEAEKQRNQLKKTGETSVDAEMLRSELENLENGLATIVEERESSKAELRARPRIRVVQRAEAEGDAVAAKALSAAPPASAGELPALTEERPPRAAGRVVDAETDEKADAAKDELELAEAAAVEADRPALPKAKKKGKAAYAMKGFRSLKIDFARHAELRGPAITFHSLGEEPRLEVTLVNRPRLDALGWGLALAVMLVGLLLTGRTLGAKARFILAVAVIATLVPLVPGGLQLAGPANMAFYAASLLVPYYLLAALLRWIVGLLGRVFCPRPAAAAAGVILLGAFVLTATAAAKSPAKLPPKSDDRFVIQVVPPPEPVKVPEDAVILPYDLDSVNGIQDARQRLVPYDKYVELWNRAYPDKKLETKKPPAPYALAGTSYTTRLEGDEYLLVEGRLEIDVYAEGQVTIPLGLGGGVLESAELDGKPARLSVARPSVARPERTNAQAKQQAEQQAANQQAREARVPQAPLVLLHISGEGRHRLRLSVRLKLERRGGWRAAGGVLPAAVAGALAITVPAAGTELRLDHIADRRSYETDKPDAKIETALGPGGAIGIRWRPKVAEAEVDRTLTARSEAVLDVQEDGLRLTWQIALEFRRGRREQFTLEVPNEYLIEKVAGTNVRGWKVDRQQAHQSLEVSLLKPARHGERLTVYLWRGGPVGEGPLAEFTVPIVTLRDAALHNGRVSIRRSPLLDLRTVKTGGVTRTDVAAKRPPRPEGAPEDQQSPLDIRPYQAYQFVTTPFSIQLAAAPVAVKAAAEVQTVLKITEHERVVESRVMLDVRGRPVHRVAILVPEDLELRDVSAPGEFQWTLSRPEQEGHKDRRLLCIYLAAGQQGEVPVTLRGKLAAGEDDKTLRLPRLEVLDVERQQGQIAVQLDPAWKVKADKLQGCQPVLLERLYGWLKPQQRRATRLALHYRRPEYSGTLSFSRRRADVSCQTITNVRVTDRAVEETILLDFTIREAGIRRLSFLLPSRMLGCRVDAPMLRQKTIEPAGKQETAPLLVTLVLQDEVMGRLRVLVENDRLLTKGIHQAPIPLVKTGNTTRRFVTLESAGRDEVVVDQKNLVGLEPVARQQKDWATLKAALGPGITQAYVVARGNQQPNLQFTTRARAVVETPGARIGLAETDLLVDANGAFRGRLIYHMDNETEQFLQIALPPGARLWTAQVAGEPVKPIKDPEMAGDRHIRIPLVKTAAGDLDYEVVLQYGGKLEPLGRLRATVDFPLVRTEKINVQRSQVRLHLPKDYRWFDFGGKMGEEGRVAGEEDLVAGYVAYQNEQAKRLLDTSSGQNPFAQVRAASNLKQIGSQLIRLHGLTEDDYGNKRLQQELAANAEILRRADEQARQLEIDAEKAEEQDNRYRLNDLFQHQETTRSRNVVKDLGRNWDAAAPQKPPAQPGAKAGSTFNRRWLDQNKLYNPELIRQSKEAKKVKMPKGKGKVQFDKSMTQPAGAARAQPKAPTITQGKPTAAPARRARSSSTQREKVSRYQQRVQEQTARQGQPAQIAGQQQLGIGGQPGGGGPGRLGGGKIDSTAVLADEDESGSTRDRRKDSGVAPASTPAPAAGLPAGLASVLVELPKPDPALYRTYRFSTLRGDVEITARAASRDLLSTFSHLAALVAAVLVAVWILRLAGGGLGWLASPSGSTLLVILGLLSVLTVVFPVAGLVALVAGIAIKVRRAWPPNREKVKSRLP